LRCSGARPALAHLACLLALAAAPPAGAAADFDHALTPTDAGPWARRYTLGIEYGVVATELGGALWFGAQDAIGRTFWQAVDASVESAAVAQGMKWGFGRERPSQTRDPGDWFRGPRYQSFPSGEVTLQGSFVTPFLLAYGRSQPWIWALEALPAYDAAARVKEGAHWQSDVIAGWALGSGFGWLAARSEQPFFVSLLPRGLQAGLRASFY
jgi:undecaprenyl-diphosphatase